MKSSLILLISLFYSFSSAATIAPPPVNCDVSVPQGMRPALVQLVHSAHEIISGPFSLPYPRPILIKWAENRDQFARMVRIQPEQITAAALPSESTVVINGEEFARQDRAEQQVTITHEYVHLFLGAHGVDVPLWLEEGLAMHLSGDLEHAASQVQLVLAYSFRRLVPVDDLNTHFPGDPGRRSLAYRQAYSLTAFLLRREYPQSGAQGLLADLIKPTRIQNRLNDKLVARALDLEWRKTLRSLWSWIAVLGSGTAFWGAVSALFLYAYMRRRQRNRQILKRWESEEAWRESVPQEFYDEMEEDEEEK